MTILPAQTEAILRLYHRMASEKNPRDEVPREPAEREDIVTISEEAKRLQVTEQTKQEVVRKLRESLLSEAR
ncbi:MAG: hypothetical protein D6778_04310 [Nitrospirae bacterium]|nr:MAG: hypothetical protein D6778_04310 [Nitrospirota bacterium]